MSYVDTDKVRKAALYTFGQVLPRAIALVHALRGVNKELFPEDSQSQFAADMASTNMMIGQIIINSCRERPEMTKPEIEELFADGMANAFRFARDQVDG